MQPRSPESPRRIDVEVAYADRDVQIVLALQVPRGTTAREAVVRAELTLTHVRYGGVERAPTCVPVRAGAPIDDATLRGLVDFGLLG